MSFLDRSNSMEKRLARQMSEIHLIPTPRNEYFPHNFISNTGDHKPVSAFFDVTLEMIIPERFQEIHSRIFRELDKLENDARPAVIISSEELNFEQINFLEPITRSTTLENIGTVLSTLKE